MVNFGQAVANYFGQYAKFTGRSTRAEYWWVQLLNVIIAAVFFLVPLVYILASGTSYLRIMLDKPVILEIGQIILTIYGLATIIPSLALTVRRLHDIGRSGWWCLGYILAVLVLSVVAFIGIYQEAMSGYAHGSHGFGAITMVVSYILMMVIFVVWLVWLCTPSAPDNEYGPNPESQEYWQ